MSNAQAAVPSGYMKNSMGHLVPVDQVGERDKLADETTRELLEAAKTLQTAMTRFKGMAMGTIESFVELSGEKYGAKMGGKKGNVTITSFDGSIKVQRQVAEHLEFDERLQAAKALIDECISEWSEGARGEIRALVNHAFQVDKEGRVSTGRVLSLRQLDIQDEKWQRAMQAIADSMQVTGSKAYVRIYERQGDDGPYVAVALDLAAL